MKHDSSWSRILTRCFLVHGSWWWEWTGCWQQIQTCTDVVDHIWISSTAMARPGGFEPPTKILELSHSVHWIKGARSPQRTRGLNGSSGHVPKVGSLRLVWTAGVGPARPKATAFLVLSVYRFATSTWSLLSDLNWSWRLYEGLLCPSITGLKLVAVLGLEPRRSYFWGKKVYLFPSHRQSGRTRTWTEKLLFLRQEGMPIPVMRPK